MSHHLVLGGARSGKSSFAESLVLSQKQYSIYIATAQAGDEEMAQRIQRHREQRGDAWQVYEEPLDLAGCIERIAKQNKKNSVVLIDCLTLWLSNCLHVEEWPERKAAFFLALRNTQLNVVMVSNEVGQGIIPLGELSRRFVDESGWLHQELAKQCAQVTLITAGLPSKLK